MGRTTGRGFGKGPRPTRGSVRMAGWVPARAVLALLLSVADERAVCVPTWVVLTCRCKDGAEVDVNDAPDEVKARASCERGRTGAALTGIPEEKNLETRWRWWCAVELGRESEHLVLLKLRVASMCSGW